MRSITGVIELAKHSYVDDGQIYSSCLLDDIDELRNQLALNSAKTEFIWICTLKRRGLIIHEPFKVVIALYELTASRGTPGWDFIIRDSYQRGDLPMSTPIMENQSNPPVSPGHRSDPTCPCIRTDEDRLLQQCAAVWPPRHQTESPAVHTKPGSKDHFWMLVVWPCHTTT